MQTSHTVICCMRFELQTKPACRGAVRFSTVWKSLQLDVRCRWLNVSTDGYDLYSDTTEQPDQRALNKRGEELVKARYELLKRTAVGELSQLVQQVVAARSTERASDA